MIKKESLFLTRKEAVEAICRELSTIRPANHVVLSNNSADFRGKYRSKEGGTEERCMDQPAGTSKYALDGRAGNG